MPGHTLTAEPTVWTLGSIATSAMDPLGSSGWQAFVVTMDGAQVREVLVIECQDVVEREEVGGADLPGAIGRDVDAVAQRLGAGAAVGRIADVPVAGARGIGGHVESGLRRRGAKGRFGQRRAADVAEADEEQRGLVHHDVR